MNCRRVQQLLSKQLDGSVPQRQASAITTHLENCSACHRRWDAFCALGAEAPQMARLLAPPDLEQRAIEHRAIERWRGEREAADGRCGRVEAAGLTPEAQRAVKRAPLLAVRRLAPSGAGVVAAVLVAALSLTIALWRHGAHETRKWVSANPPLPSRQLAPRPDASPRLSVQYPSQEEGSPRVARRSVPDPAASTKEMRRRGRLYVPGVGLVHVNRDPKAAVAQWVPLPQEEWNRLQERVQRTVRPRDDFVQIPFPRLASISTQQIAAAVESYKREAAVVDARLSHEVTVQQKATALSDLCDHLRADTGIQLAAGSSVADEKVTVFCEKQPLRDVMRQLSRPFGYAWIRSGKAGEYRYELVQDLRSQLLEEELRNRDHNTALLALQQELEKYRPYLSLTPDEILARAKTASPVEKKLLENLGGGGPRSGLGYGPIVMYFRLSPQEMAAARAGQWLSFSADPRPGERPLPPDVDRGILQSWRWERILRSPIGLRTTGAEDPDGVPVASVPELHATLAMTLVQSELGQYDLAGLSGFRGVGMNRNDIRGIASGRSPKILQPDNETINVRFAGDPALRPRLSVQPQPSCRATPAPGAFPDSSPNPRSAPEPKVITADVLEALCRATHLPLVADSYTRLYKPETVSVRNQSRFAALNHLSDAMRLRWNKDGNWLQFRSTSFYDDRLKEVPNRLLTRWAAARRQHGFLTLEDLVEIAQLSDDQLKGEEMAEGARLCYGLDEWDVARNHMIRPNLRFLAQFAPGQRQEATTASGLPFTKMTLAQQQGFLNRALGQEGEGLRSLEELAGATLRVDYWHPGWYEWRTPGPDALRWVVPLGPPPDGRRVLRPVVRERTREAALQALRQVDPAIREAVRNAALRFDPRLDQDLSSEEAQIVPTNLDLATIYIPCTTSKFPVQFQMTDYNSGISGW
jgi:hypothetical protein